MWNSMFYSAHNGQINTIASNPLSETLKKMLHNNSFRSGTHKERTIPLLSLGEILEPKYGPIFFPQASENRW